MGFFKKENFSGESSHVDSKQEVLNNVKNLEGTMERMGEALGKMNGKGLVDIEYGNSNLDIIKAVVGASPEHAMQTFEAEKQKLEAKKEQKIAPEHSSIKQSMQEARQSQKEDLEMDVSESNSFGIK